MHFDDRLATVLRQPVSGKVIARIQYRQLIDLLGTAPDMARGAALDAAFARLEMLSQSIPLAERAAMIRDPGLRLRNPQVVMFLAEGEPAIATAAIAGARLDDDQWLDLIPALSIRSRGILRHRRGLGSTIDNLLDRLGIMDRGLPPGTGGQAISAVPVQDGIEDPIPALAEGQEGSIGAIVKRIEEYRKTRQAETASGLATDAPRLPLDDGHEDAAIDEIAAFDFLTDANLRICWADEQAAPMTIGIPLFGDEAIALGGRASSTLSAFVRHRQPIRSCIIAIHGAPAIAGEWQVDASPRFDRQTGGFTGYAGRARRRAMQPADDTADRLADRMRQILHELRNPANAIQFSAEAIQYQVLGGVSNEYRALAAGIASDTAHVLAGFDELDRLVRLDTGAMEMEPGESDLAATVNSTIERLRAYTVPRESGFVTRKMPDSSAVPVAQEELDRLVWRLLSCLARAAGPGEIIAIEYAEIEHWHSLSIDLPAQLSGYNSKEIFSIPAEERSHALSSGMFGTGFTLRLAATEARAAGGSLQLDAGRICLALPGLTEMVASHSNA